MAKLDLILLRHGNTFAPGDKVVWVGSALDLPLVPSGQAQAKACAGALRDSAPIDGVYCGRLRRTREFAEIICQELRLSAAPIVDPRLDELDYGAWSGLSKEEVIQKFGAEELHAWEKNGVWPQNGGWGGSAARVLSEVSAFVGDLTESLKEADSDRRILAVSSNGRLRYFLRLAPGEFERRAGDGSMSVRTGHICRLTSGPRAVEVVDWNVAPENFA